MKKLLLHVCCAPCSTSVIESLAKEYKISLFFYNPNIHPLSEQQKRLEETTLYAAKMGMDIYSWESDVIDWFNLVEEYKWSSEKSGERCMYCYEERLMRTAEKAKNSGFDIFATTLTVSPYKHMKSINEIGLKIASKVGVSYLESDFKKNGGYQRSIEMSKQEYMYRQNYCGCVFSKLERLRIKPYN